MNVSITSRREPVSSETKDYISTQVQKLSRFFGRMQNVEVVIDSDGPLHKTCEVKLRAMQHDILAKESSPENLYKAVDECVEDLRRQLTKIKDKKQNH